MPGFVEGASGIHRAPWGPAERVSQNKFMSPHWTFRAGTHLEKVKKCVADDSISRVVSLVLLTIGCSSFHSSGDLGKIPLRIA